MSGTQQKLDPVDELIERRNAIQLKAELFGDTYANECWSRLGVANRHIQRICQGELTLVPGVRKEIEDCLERVQKWLAE
jgi:hypothetical protein